MGFDISLGGIRSTNTRSFIKIAIALQMDAAVELGRNPVSKHRFSLSMEMSRLTRDGTAEPARETKLSGANEDRDIINFSVQLTTSKIGNLTRLSHTLAICVPIHTTSSDTYFGFKHSTSHRFTVNLDF